MATSSSGRSGRSGVEGSATCSGGISGSAGVGVAMACARFPTSGVVSSGRSGRSGVALGAGPTSPSKSSSLGASTVGEYKPPFPVWTGSATSSIGLTLPRSNSTYSFGASSAVNSTSSASEDSTVDDRVGPSLPMNSKVSGTGSPSLSCAVVAAYWSTSTVTSSKASTASTTGPMSSSSSFSPSRRLMISSPEVEGSAIGCSRADMLSE